MKIKTANLIGKPLDYAVAKCQGVTTATIPYSSNWGIAGVIIECKKINITFSVESDCIANHSADFELDHVQRGPTPLIAALRCYVASELGDEVEIPEELL